MDDKLNEWCKTNNLLTIEASLREKCMVCDPEELKQADTSDIEQMIVECDMKFGEKARFRAAVERLKQLNTPPTPTPEEVLINQKKYLTKKQLGKGGFGVVYKAIDAQTKVVVAIKQVSPEPNCPKDWFAEELKAHTAVSHPSVPRVPKLIEHSTEGLQAFVMEFVPGKTAWEHYCPGSQDIFSAPKATKFLLQTLETLDAIHERGILHRDIKPANIIIHKYTQEPWLFDFGIAKDLALTTTTTPTNVGTLPFRPPEYLLQVDRYTDIFGLGATVLALFNPVTSHDLTWETVLEKCTLTNELKNVISLMIAHDHKKRFQNCKDVLAALKVTQPPEQDAQQLSQKLELLAAENSNTLKRLQTLEDQLASKKSVKTPEVEALMANPIVALLPWDIWSYFARCCFWNLRDLERLQLVSKLLSTFVWDHLLTKLCFNGSMTDTRLEFYLHEKSFRLCNHLDTLVLDGPTKITNSGLVSLKDALSLTKLGLRSIHITDPGLSNLASLQKLTALDLSCQKVGNAGVEHLSGLVNLTELFLVNSKINYDGLAALNRLTKIQALRLNGARSVGPEGLHGLRDLTNLRTLNIARWVVSNSGMQHITAFQKLNSLTLSKCPSVSDGALVWFKPLTALGQLRLNKCNMGNGALAHLTQIPSLTYLNLVNCVAINDDGLSCLKSLTGLKELRLNGCHEITDEGVGHVAGLNLTYLNLSRCRKITDAGLEHLYPITTLSKLYFNGCFLVTPEAISKFPDKIEIHLVQKKK